MLGLPELRRPSATMMSGGPAKLWRKMQLRVSQSYEGCGGGVGLRSRGACLGGLQRLSEGCYRG